MPLTIADRRPTARMLVLLLWVIGAYWFAANEADPDLWGHVKYGMDLLESGELPTYDPYSYATIDKHRQPWFNHELGAEIAFAFLYSHWGEPGLLAPKVALGLATVAIAGWISRRQRIELGPWIALSVVAIWSLAIGWAVRPQIFSYFFFAWLLLILDAGERKPVYLFLTLPLMTAWVNFHGGFVFGLGVLGISLATNVLESAAARDMDRLRIYLAVGVGACLATVLNPYGLDAHWGLIRELGIPRTHIGEWSPVPWNMEVLRKWARFEIVPYHALMLLALAALLLSRRPMSWRQRILLIIILIETQLHQRHAPFLGLAALAWLPVHVQDVADRALGWLGRRSSPEPPADEPWNASLFVFGAIWLAAVVGVGVATIGQTRHIHVERSAYPVDAFEFIASRRLKGKIVTAFNPAQYLIFAFYPDLFVSFDGRYGTVYDTYLLDMNFDFYYPDDPKVRSRDPHSPKYDPGRVLDFLSPNLALVDQEQSKPYRIPQRTLESRSDWTLLYEDPVAQVWGRAEQYADPKSPDFIAPVDRVRRTETPTGWSAFPATPAARD